MPLDQFSYNHCSIFILKYRVCISDFLNYCHRCEIKYTYFFSFKFVFPKELQHTYLKIGLASTLWNTENSIGFAQGKQQIIAIWRFTAFNNFGFAYLYFIVRVTSALNVYSSLPKDADTERKIIW